MPSRSVRRVTISPDTKKKVVKPSLNISSEAADRVEEVSASAAVKPEPKYKDSVRPDPHIGHFDENKHKPSESSAASTRRPNTESSQYSPLSPVAAFHKSTPLSSPIASHTPAAVLVPAHHPPPGSAPNVWVAKNPTDEPLLDSAKPTFKKEIIVRSSRGCALVVPMRFRERHF